MKLENATDLNNFIDFFKQYGDDLVELAKLSGDRQNVSATKLINCFRTYLEMFLKICA